MLEIGLALVAVVWASWFAFMIRYPQHWSSAIDAIHARLSPWGLSASWMQRAEKGHVLKFIVGATAFVTLVCLAILIRHPDALSNFIRSHHG